MRVIALALALFAASPAAARDDVAGAFDYYVLALSWSPSWCATEGEADDAQCREHRDFIVHGLWPNREDGWPEYCATRARDPSRQETAAMADLMGSDSLAWHQWKKHGRCAGMKPEDYFATLRDAAAAVTIPPEFEDLARDIRLPVAVVEDAFIAANPGLARNGITVTCDGGRLDEVRICLTPGLSLRDCAPDARRDCRADALMMERVR
ncbi:ribonuclease T [Paracoccus sp. S-4012]|uniref:ribonuclease T2 family protein n=1 Tax=Paracoccus sp. S-4012 TaxID=2665648 RepID=UPI0012AEEACB|nr:ribonuclease T2 [Paracoccus sp. S-4012]MRX49662.1 ribonuclease T [Paracoccus sp. S-4012]